MELYRSWNPSMTESSAKGQPLGLLKLKSAGCRRSEQGAVAEVLDAIEGLRVTGESRIEGGMLM